MPFQFNPFTDKRDIVGTDEVPPSIATDYQTDNTEFYEIAMQGNPILN